MALRKIDEFTEGNVSVKVHKDSENGEFRARVYVDGKANEAADYFDGDKESTIDTAKIMLSETVKGNTLWEDGSAPAVTTNPDGSVTTVTEDAEGVHSLTTGIPKGRPVYHVPGADVPIPASSKPVQESRNKREGYYAGHTDFFGPYGDKAKHCRTHYRPQTLHPVPEQ